MQINWPWSYAASMLLLLHPAIWDICGACRPMHLPALRIHPAWADLVVHMRNSGPQRLATWPCSLCGVGAVRQRARTTCVLNSSAAAQGRILTPAASGLQCQHPCACRLVSSNMPGPLLGTPTSCLCLGRCAPMCAYVRLRWWRPCCSWAAASTAACCACVAPSVRRLLPRWLFGSLAAHSGP